MSGRFRYFAPVICVVLALLLSPTAPSSATTTPSMAVSPSATKVVYGASVRFTVKVRRGATGQRATLQRQVGTTWKVVASKRLPRTAPVKKVVLGVTVTWAGAARLRVVLAPKGSTRGLRSKAYVVTTTPATYLASRTPVGHAGAQESARPSISADGRFTVFESAADDLSAGDGNAAMDVFLWDRMTRRTTRISTYPSALGTGPSREPVISADGAYVAFATSVPIAPGDGNGAWDVYRWTRATGAFKLISVAGATPADSSSRYPSISADGKHIAFQSDATNLAGGGASTDVFLWDEGAPALTLVSHGDLGVAGNGASGVPSISADGSSVAFESLASNIAQPGWTDANGKSDVFLWQRGSTSGSYIVSSDATGTAASNGESWAPSVSSDGTYVAFESRGTNIPGDDDGGASSTDVFRWDLNHPTQPVNVSAPALAGAGGTPAYAASISGDGSRVAFIGNYASLTSNNPDGPDQALVWRAGQPIRRLSLSSSGLASDGYVSDVALSPTAAWAAFVTNGTILVPGAGATAAHTEVYVRGMLS